MFHSSKKCIAAITSALAALLFVSCAPYATASYYGDTLFTLSGSIASEDQSVISIFQSPHVWWPVNGSLERDFVQDGTTTIEEDSRGTMGTMGRWSMSLTRTPPNSAYGNHSLLPGVATGLVILTDFDAEGLNGLVAHARILYSDDEEAALRAGMPASGFATQMTEAFDVDYYRCVLDTEQAQANCSASCWPDWNLCEDSCSSSACRAECKGSRQICENECGSRPEIDLCEEARSWVLTEPSTLHFSVHRDTENRIPTAAFSLTECLSRTPQLSQCQRQCDLGRGFDDCLRDCGASFKAGLVCGKTPTIPPCRALQLCLLSSSLDCEASCDSDSSTCRDACLESPENVESCAEEFDPEDWCDDPL